MSETRYAMVADTRRCVGCQSCALACQAENGLSSGAFRNWIETETKGQFPNVSMTIRSLRCHHCANPPCVDACPTGASHVGEGGTVLVNHSKCTGCKACIGACPYDARYIDAGGYADKCTFCLHRVKAGKLPACVSNCPSKALAFGDLNDSESDVSRQLAKSKHEVVKPEQGTRPNLYFLI